MAHDASFCSRLIRACDEEDFGLRASQLVQLDEEAAFEGAVSHLERVPAAAQRLLNRSRCHKLSKEHGVNLAGVKFTGDLAKDYVELKKVKAKLDEKAADYAHKLATEFPNKGASDDSRATREWARSFDERSADAVRKLNSKVYSLDKAIQPINIFFNTHNTPEELEDRWLMHADVAENTLQLCPIRANFLFHDYFKGLGEKFIFMSATLGTKEALCRELGLPSKEVLYIEVDTPFPPERSPIISIPALDLTMSRKQENMKLIGPIIEEILEAHKGQRGIIHSATYAFGTEVYKQVSDEARKRLLFRDMELLDGALSGKAAKYGQRFKNSELLKMHAEGYREASVLVSPSMMEGVDLYDDLSEFQIILKMPWGSLGDPRIAKKRELDQDWYVNKVWVHVMQASGRSTRHENDSSVTYILDHRFMQNYKAWQGNLPAWFKKRVVTTK